MELQNLFIASDYVRMYTDIACMEAANEAARRAVNCLLLASGSNSQRRNCGLSLLSLSPSRKSIGSDLRLASIIIWPRARANWQVDDRSVDDLVSRMIPHRTP